MKKWMIVLLTLSLLLSSCALSKKGDLPSPAEEIPSFEPTEAVEEVHALPDLMTMSFVEKNGLYLQLLAEKQAEGADTTLAESSYQKSVEASLSGNSQKADQALNDAIQYLWNL